MTHHSFCRPSGAKRGVDSRRAKEKDVCLKYVIVSAVKSETLRGVVEVQRAPYYSDRRVCSLLVDEMMPKGRMKGKEREAVGTFLILRGTDGPGSCGWRQLRQGKIQRCNKSSELSLSGTHAGLVPA